MFKIGYYKERLEAQQFMLDIINKFPESSDGFDLKKLYLIILERYGFGKNFVDKYLRLLDDNFRVKISKGKVWCL